MRLIIVCGNEECRKEYAAKTEDGEWNCPHCGRRRGNEYHPFLDARLMQARIDGDRADWPALTLDIIARVREMLKERDQRIAALEKVVAELRGGEKI